MILGHKGRASLQLLAATRVAVHAHISQSAQQHDMASSKARPARALKFTAFLLLVLLGQTEQISQRSVARAQPSTAGSPCVVLPKLPLSVGFIDSLPMTAAQLPDGAIRGVLRGVKSWLCGPATTSQSLYADSLRAAIEGHQTLLFEQIRFDTRQFKLAHVLVTDSRVSGDDDRHTWHVRVELSNGAWKVMHASEAPPALFD